MIKGHFIQSHTRHVWVTQIGSDDAQKHVLVLPSLFEEMNLCRAIVAKQAQFLAQKGYCVYLLDYAGTGDSEGEINEVTAQDWQQNIVDTCAWLSTKGVQNLNIWGVRFGALMAMTCLEKITQVLKVNSLLLWKPVSKGKQFMTQFLRLKQASSMMQGQEKVNWRESILSGNDTEVAGYPINSALLASIDELQMPKVLDIDLPIHWLELSASKMTPAIQMQIKQWPEERVHVSFFEGSAFWQIPEIFEQVDLHEPTYLALESSHD